MICMEVGPELCKTVKGKQQRLKSCGDKVKMLLGKTQLLCSFGFPGGGREIQQFYVANTFTKYFSAKKINGEIVIFDTIVIQTIISQIWSVISFLKNTKCL